VAASFAKYVQNKVRLQWSTLSSTMLAGEDRIFRLLLIRCQKSQAKLIQRLLSRADEIMFPELLHCTAFPVGTSSPEENSETGERERERFAYRSFRSCRFFI
jgi:hypothetical protein